MRAWNRYVLALLLVLSIAASVQAEPKTVRLLTIGNSFADNALTYLPQIAEAAGDKLVSQRANIGGCPMEKHWKLAEKFEVNPEDPDGKPYAGKKSSLAQMLAADRWDVVTIQQLSSISHDVKTYQPYAKELFDYVHAHAPQAKVMIQQTWAYRMDDPRFKPGQKDDGQPHSYQAMYEQVRAAYRQVAGELGIAIIPSGDAMYLGDVDPTFGYKPDATFDFKVAQPPALPDQTHSLHHGWGWHKQTDGSMKLMMDGHHAGTAGCYLIGCVWYESLFGKDVTDNTFVPKGLDADYAKFLRAVAHRAVENLKKAE